MQLILTMLTFGMASPPLGAAVSLAAALEIILTLLLVELYLQLSPRCSPLAFSSSLQQLNLDCSTPYFFASSSTSTSTSTSTSFLKSTAAAAPTAMAILDEVRLESNYYDATGGLNAACADAWRAAPRLTWAVASISSCFWVR